MGNPSTRVTRPPHQLRAPLITNYLILQQATIRYYIILDYSVSVTSSWHVRELCPVLPQRPQRLRCVVPLLARPLFAGFSPSSCPAASFEAINLEPSSIINIP